MDDRDSMSWPALTIWFGGQFIVLLLSACRIPLAARYPQPAEALAPYLLSAAQFILIALLFPTLQQTRQSTLLVIASILPILQLAGILGGTDVTTIWQVATISVLFVTALTICMKCLQRRMFCGVMRLGIIACVIGPAALEYLGKEFATGNTLRSSRILSHFSPLIDSLDLFAGKTVRFSIFVSLVLSLVGGMIARAVILRRR